MRVEDIRWGEISEWTARVARKRGEAASPIVGRTVTPGVALGAAQVLTSVGEFPAGDQIVTETPLGGPNGIPQ